MPPLQNFRGRTRSRYFALGLVKRAEGHVVSAGFAGLDGGMARIVTTDTEDGSIAQQAPGITKFAFIGADMLPVSATLGCEVWPVIDDKRYVAGVAHWHQFFYSFAYGIIICVF